MLLEKCDDPFDDDHYIFEPKINGHRLILSHIGGKTNLYTRNNNECTRQYPEILRVPTNDDVVLDGEVACIDPETGDICFESVMERFRMTKHTKIRYAYKTQPVHFVVFDILFHNGRDLRQLPLLERKRILHSVIENNAYISCIKHVEDRGIALFNAIQERNMEGMVAKRKDSVYLSERSKHWLKIINWTCVDVFISGYRKKEFGWLVSIPTDNGFRPVGVIEFGATPTHRKAFYRLSKKIVSGEDRHFVYVEPRIKATVKIRNWTQSGMLRSPAFVDFAV
jgi:DNA ligase-1